MLDFKHMDAWEIKQAASHDTNEDSKADVVFEPHDNTSHLNNWTMSDLEYRLLSHGGKSVCLPDLEEDIASILERGIFWNGADAEIMRGIPSQCHLNAANLWSNNRDKTTIMTGYALSADGIWRQHSWLVAFDNENYPYIVETTEERISYYGFAMTYEECERFLYWNS